MGDIADAMLDGTLCEGCGVYLHGPTHGVPRRCRDCRPSKAEQAAINIARNKAEHAAAKKHPCPTCGKRLRLVGMADHMRDAHPATAAQAETAQAAPVGCQCPACAPVLHASDCAVHNAPAMSVGPCNCGAAPGLMPLPAKATKEMMVAAVKYANGDAVYKNVAAGALEIEEQIYGEIWEAMVAATPGATHGK